MPSTWKAKLSEPSELDGEPRGIFRVSLTPDPATELVIEFLSDWSRLIARSCSTMTIILSLLVRYLIGIIIYQANSAHRTRKEGRRPARRRLKRLSLLGELPRGSLALRPHNFFQCDVITVNCPLHEGTRDLLNKHTLSRTKRGVWVVNTARGAVCNAEAIAEGLKSGHINGYAGDVWNRQPAPKNHVWRTMKNPLGGGNGQSKTTK